MTSNHLAVLNISKSNKINQKQIRHSKKFSIMFIYAVLQQVYKVKWICKIVQRFLFLGKLNKVAINKRKVHSDKNFFHVCINIFDVDKDLDINFVIISRGEG